MSSIPSSPRILTTTVGSYPIPNWLSASPTETALIDATRVVFDIQRQARIDLATDGELYRFDVNHPDTNGMIEYFVHKMSGITCQTGRSATEEFRTKQEMSFRSRPAGIVEGPIGEGSLNLLSDCQRAASVTDQPFKFTLTSPYMLSRTLLDRHYKDIRERTLAIARVLSQQVHGLPCDCVQIDEANIPGNPKDAPLAAEAINLVLDAVTVEKAVHFCFGNYGGQTIQTGNWKTLIEFLNSLRTDHLVLELAHRPLEDLQALSDIDAKIQLGIGVVDVKINHIETPDEIARSLEQAEKALGPNRIRWIHPDCGFWMLNRSVANRKIEALAAGRDKYLAIS